MNTREDIKTNRRKTLYAASFILTALLNFFIFNDINTNPLPQDLKSRKNELEKLNKSINETRKKINKLSGREKSTLNALNTYQKHIANAKKYISLLDEELTSVRDSIDLLRKQLKLAGEDHSQVKSDFSRIAGKAYAERNMSTKEILLTKNSYINDLNDRIIIEWLAERSAKKLKDITRFMDSTQFLVKKMYEQSLRHEEVKQKKEEEKYRLNRTLASKKNLLGNLRKDKKNLNRQLRQKEESARKLKSIIAELIRQSKEKESAKKLPIGSLSRPCKSENLLHGYGQYKNPETGTVFDNPGIDISAKNGSAVYAAADGTISLVDWLPGYGSLIIIDHGNNVRTVYANLSSVNVKKGTKIKRGMFIGKSGESVDGEFLHFEVWQGSTRLNPSKYLK